MFFIFQLVRGGGLLQVARDAKYMWQGLWPIANKYQGDNIDPD